MGRGRLSDTSTNSISRPRCVDKFRLKYPLSVSVSSKHFVLSKEENDELNGHVMCYLRGRHRKIGIFKINPPFEGTFFLKVYAKPEDEILDETDTLDHVATFVVYVHDVRVLLLSLPTCLAYSITSFVSASNPDPSLPSFRDPLGYDCRVRGHGGDHAQHDRAHHRGYR